jgi:hypothetical protein
VLLRDFFRVVRPVTGTEVKAFGATMDFQAFDVH